MLWELYGRNGKCLRLSFDVHLFEEKTENL